ncbi:succinate dehydrogenase [Bacteroidia bacterium]|nr:succinate dehydrogenase [Bacteroidia bacterium]
MSNLLTSSIGKKLVMSISGLFLITFLCVHLTINLFILFDSSGELFNLGAHFMTNPVIKIIEYVLFAGLIVHFTWATVLTIQNLRARPVGYAKSKQGENANWASRNMFIIGGVILIFLIIHLYNFWWNIKGFGELFGIGEPVSKVIIDGVEMHDTYALVAGLLRNSVCYCIIYIIGAIFLGLHLTHGFWSAFQSIGFSNDLWRKRLEVVAYLFAVIIALGFGIIPVSFLIGCA